jgi:hypothetical protein
MLSRIIKVSFVRTFSTNSPATRSTEDLGLIARGKVTQQELEEASRFELKELAAVVNSERKHLAYYANE